MKLLRSRSRFLFSNLTWPFLFLALLSTPSFSQTSDPAPTQCDQAAWLTWSDWTACSDNCGSCGFHLRTRTCLTTSASCDCPGDSTTVEFCNRDVCRYPRPACCFNQMATSLNGRFTCAEIDSSTL